MAEEIRVLQLDELRYAAEVHEGEQTTEHRVLFTQGFLDDLELPEPDHEQLVEESVKYLLQQMPSTSLPHDINLDRVSRDYDDFLPELRQRILG